MGNKQGNVSRKTGWSLDSGQEHLIGTDTDVKLLKPPAGWVLGKTAHITKFYEMGSITGQPGSFGYAVRATRLSDGKKVAVKVIDKKVLHEESFEDLRAELIVMKSLSHPHIVDAYEAFESKRKLYLVMQLCQGGELFDRILEEGNKRKHGAYSEAAAAAVLKQLFKGVGYLHEHKIAHCDLKPDNFLMLHKNDSVVKIIDFGMTKFCTSEGTNRGDGELRGPAGTPNYMAPEVWDGRYTFYCDMWSMGVVMFVMLFGFFPFNIGPSDNEKKLKRLIQAGFSKTVKPGNGPWFPERIPVSAAAMDLMGKLMELDPTARITCEEALAHPWLNGQATKTALVGHVLSNLKATTEATKLKGLLLTKFSDTLMSDTELAALRQAFTEMDTDGNGRLTVSEIKQALQGRDDMEAAARMLLSLSDADGDGELSYHEFLMASTQRRLTAKEGRLHQMFEKFDQNGDGRLSPQEIQQALGNVEGLQKMISDVDTDGDGQLDKDEFIEIFLQSGASI